MTTQKQEEFKKELEVLLKKYGIDYEIKSIETGWKDVVVEPYVKVYEAQRQMIVNFDDYIWY